MQNIFKSIFILFTLVLTSCSSDDAKPAPQVFTPTVYAMKGTLDSGVTKLMQNAQGNNRANPNSTEFGLSYFTLNGFYDNSSPNGRAPIEDKIVTVNIAIPKDNIALGEHLFTSTLVADQYFADMDIKLNGTSETVNTVSGKINVLTFDELTGEITGTYEFTTTNGTNPLTHSITGDFNYVMIDN